MSEDRRDDTKGGTSRWGFLAGAGVAAGGAALAGSARAQQDATPAEDAAAQRLYPVRFTLNGEWVAVAVDPRRTLLDYLREEAGLTGTKVGCNHGQCGACTVHIDGAPRLSCLTLATQADGAEVLTIEGLADKAERNGIATEDGLHPLQAAFVEQDAFQCGYCTPGQIMSGVAVIEEGHAGSEAEVREYMSGNLCRCAAYPQITKAIMQAKSEVDIQKRGGGARQDYHLGLKALREG